MRGLMPDECNPERGCRCYGARALKAIASQIEQCEVDNPAPPVEPKKWYEQPFWLGVFTVGGFLAGAFLATKGQ